TSPLSSSPLASPRSSSTTPRADPQSHRPTRLARQMMTRRRSNRSAVSMRGIARTARALKADPEMTTMPRLTAEERREAVLEAASMEFAAHGYERTSTEKIARRVGISQPYIFRLFGTKRNLFEAAVRRCLVETPGDLDRRPEPWSERIFAAIKG